MLKESALVSGGTFVSRLLGLVRDILFAHFLGASFAADAFFVAFKIPNLFRRLFAEGSFSQAFVPVLSDYVTTKSVAEVHALISTTCAWLLLFLLPLTTLGIMGSEWLVRLYAFGLTFNTNRFALAASLVQITFCYLLFISLVAFCSAVLQTHNRFALPALAPAWLNVCFIGAVAVSTQVAQPVYALAWAVPVAGVVQLVFVAYGLMRLGYLPKPCLPKAHPGVKRILLLMLPTLFAVSVHQINLLVDMQLAAFLAVGSISWLSYGDRIMSFPLALIGIAVTTVVLPSLAKAYAQQAVADFCVRLAWGIKVICLLGVPATCGILLLAPYILVTLFYHGGALTLSDIDNISSALRAYALGLPAFMLVKVATAAFFSQSKAGFAVKAGIVSVVVNIIASLLLVQSLNHIGLALATAIAALTNGFLLLKGLYDAKQVIINKHTVRFSLLLAIAVCIMLGALLIGLPSFETFVAYHWLVRALVIVGLVLLGIGSYLGALWCCGMRIKHIMA